MRDRGITHPAPKAGIALALALAGGAALAWSLATDGPVPARSLGAVALVLGTGFALNYLYTHSLMNRMRRGENVIARWHVSPATLALFEQTERARKRGKNNWRGWRKQRPQGLEVIFTRDAAVVGETWFSLRKRGVSRVTHTHIERGAVTYIQFAMTVTIAPGPQTPRTNHLGHLRVPVADDAGVEAARVVGCFVGL